MNLSKVEQQRWNHHYKHIKKQSDSIKKAGSCPYKHDDGVEHVALVLDAIACHRYSVFRLRNLEHWIDKELFGRWVISVLRCLIDHGFVSYYNNNRRHGHQYQRLFDIECIPDVIREVCL